MILSFERLLDEFKKIPITKVPEQTFLDIAGYPHYENVCSNILSFYFRTDESHRLNDMLLKALLKVSNEDKHDLHIDKTEVEREVITEKGNRIDIVIKTENLFIGIENKIYHHISNDLDDYSQFIDNNSKGRKTLKILLSLSEIDEEQLTNSGFHCVTYSNLFSHILESIGNYLLHANHKYVAYLMDFINTITRLERGNTMNKEFIEFLKQNENTVNQFIVGLEEVKKQSRLKIKTLSSLVDTSKLKILYNVWEWPDREPTRELYDSFVYIIEIKKDLLVEIDCILSPSGWYFDIWNKKGSTEQFKEFLTSKNIKLIESHSPNKKMYPREFNYDDDIKEIANTLQSIIDTIAG